MNIPLIGVVDRALRDAGIPIEGVRIGNPADRSTWLVFYAPSATAAHRTQGDALLLTVDTQDAVVAANVKTDLVISQADTELIKAVTQGLWECIPAPTMTKVQLRARIIAIWKAL
jgi:hypothetical protein